MTEFKSLSEKRYEGKNMVAHTFNGLFREKDVREFIRLLKDIFDVEGKIVTNRENVHKEIDKIFGPELTQTHSPRVIDSKKSNVFADFPADALRGEKTCAKCGGLKKIRNPTGHCDHLYYPDNVKGAKD